MSRLFFVCIIYELHHTLYNQIFLNVTEIHHSGTSESNYLPFVRCWVIQICLGFLKYYWFYSKIQDDHQKSKITAKFYENN